MASSGFVAIIDPFSTGARVAEIVKKKGIRVIAVYSASIEQLDRVQSLVPQGLDLCFDGVVYFDQNVSIMVERLQSFSGKCIAVIAGAECGVELADQLSELLELRSNGTISSFARRNKFEMGEGVRSAGLRAANQLKSNSWTDLSKWITDWNPVPFKVIIKPCDSAGSDNVTLCNSLAETKLAFENIIGKVNGLGIVNDYVLAQEYLEGEEYVIDAISRDGEHKIVAIWEYDRRPINGAHFVCFGQKLLTMSDPRCAELVSYQKQVLSALHIVNGPSHGEVKWCHGEAVLVEVGARCHGAEGSWIEPAQLTLGYNQANLCVDLYLEPASFEHIPDTPVEARGHGRLLFIIVKSGGILSRVNQAFVEEIAQMSSVLGFEIFLKPGQQVIPTIDCFTFGGLVKMYHSNLEVIAEDWNRIRQMEDLGFFELVES